MINNVINKFLANDSVSQVELLEAFEEIFSGLANDIQSSAFITALNDIKMNEDVLLTAIQASCQSIKKPYSVLNSQDMIENISFGDKTKYFDISLIQDLICCACDLPISRYSFGNDISSRTFDILSLMGINLSKEIDYSTNDFKKLNFNYYKLSCELPYSKYTKNLNHSLPFDNILKITSKMLNPLCASNLFLGVNKKSNVEIFANLALKLNKTNSIIVCANDSLPFVSTKGETYVAEAWKNKIFTYILTPQLLGIEDFEVDLLKCENNSQNASDILDIIKNKNKSAKYCASILNSALALYIAKKADSIIDGLSLAKKVLKEGLVEEKFEQIKAFYS
ncbi:MAG: hypothetical protein IJB79_04395 [Candidatus Gastranaerophilales bacterium]|nr:hypothetical protein [Candidatus Gastranaerophilales bacterium]